MSLSGWSVQVEDSFEMNKIDVYRKALDNLEGIIAKFEQELEKPELVHGAFVYRSPTVKHVCLLKAVRVVSGANALLVLLQAGYVTEMGVLIRTVGDCINDIYFLLENFPETAPEVEKYVANFFSDGIPEEFDILEEASRKIPRTKVRKIHASRARLLSEYTNLAIDRDLVYRIYSAYSGYVHAGFHSIMELCNRSAPHRFRLKGIKEPVRIHHWEVRFIALLRRTTLVFGYMAEKYNKPDLIREIRNTIDWFDRKIAYVQSAS